MNRLEKENWKLKIMILNLKEEILDYKLKTKEITKRRYDIDKKRCGNCWLRLENPDVPQSLRNACDSLNLKGD